MVGGFVIIFYCYVEFDKIKICEYIYGEVVKLVKKIVGYDVNVFYFWVFC